MVDVNTRQVLAEVPVGVEPEGMGVSPDGKIVVNTSETTNMAHLIDTSTFEIVENVLVDSRPRFAEYTPDGKLLLRLGRDRRHGQRHRPGEERGRSTRSPSRCRACCPRRSSRSAIRVTADGAKAYVALGPANRVAVVDTATWEVTDYLLVGQRVWQLAFSQDGKFLYTTNGNSNDISVIDVETDKVLKSVQVGEQPWGVVAVKSSS